MAAINSSFTWSSIFVDDMFYIHVFYTHMLPTLTYTTRLVCIEKTADTTRKYPCDAASLGVSRP